MAYLSFSVLINNKSLKNELIEGKYDYRDIRKNFLLYSNS